MEVGFEKALTKASFHIRNVIQKCQINAYSTNVDSFRHFKSIEVRLLINYDGILQ